MSEFWWGVLSLPIIIVAVAAAVAAVLGTWHLIDAWSEARWRKLPPVAMPEKYGTPKGFNGWTNGDSGRRGAFISLLLTGMKGFGFRVTSNIGVLVIYGATKSDQQRAKILHRALEKAMVEVSKDNDDAK